MAESVVSIDPRTGRSVEVVAESTSPVELEVICGAARDAQQALDRMLPRGRAALLRSMAEALEADGDALIALADRESGLGLTRLTGELARTCYQLRLFADVAEDGGYLEAILDSAAPTPAGPRPDLRRMLVPLGPVAVFEASNFPLAFGVPGGDTASALAAGCPVIVKAHPAHPATAERCLAALRAGARLVGAPESVVSLVHGVQAGIELVSHPRVAAAAFTGSLHGGEALAKLAAGRAVPIPFYGEYGSVNPVVITPLAAQQRAASIAHGYATSFTAGTGQFCTKPGLVFLPCGDDGALFTKELEQAVAQTGPGTLLTAAIRDQFSDGVARLLALPGVEVLGRSRAETGTGFAAAPVVLRTSVDELGRAGTALLEECFGPVSVVAEYRSRSDLVAALERLPGSLTATLHTGEGESADIVDLHDVLARRSGRIIYNAYPTGVAVSWAIHHGGPWPSTNGALHTSVGATAIRRFLRPMAFQDAPQSVLPGALQDSNPWGVPRRVDGVLTLAPQRG